MLGRGSRVFIASLFSGVYLFFFIVVFCGSQLFSRSLSSGVKIDCKVTVYLFFIPDM